MMEHWLESYEFWCVVELKEVGILSFAVPQELRLALLLYDW